MAAPYNPPTKGEEFQIDIGLEDMVNPGSLKANPTLAAGDWKVTKDGGAENNLTTLPVVQPASSTTVRLALSATEMTADVVTITGIDQTNPKEWMDFKLSIPTT
jgi:hypothetical protein